MKNLPANAGGARDVGLTTGSGRSPREGNGSPLQDSCRENPMRQRSLAGYSPWGCKESDMTELTCFYPGLTIQSQYFVYSITFPQF